MSRRINGSSSGSTEILPLMILIKFSRQKFITPLQRQIRDSSAVQGHTKDAMRLGYLDRSVRIFSVYQRCLPFLADLHVTR